MIKVTKVTHYDTDDSDFGSDYFSIDLTVEQDGKQIFYGEYGDYYHDKGHKKVEAILEFVKEVFGDYELIATKVADGKY